MNFFNNIIAQENKSVNGDDDSKNIKKETLAKEEYEYIKKLYTKINYNLYFSFNLLIS